MSFASRTALARASVFAASLALVASACGNSTSSTIPSVALPSLASTAPSTAASESAAASSSSGASEAPSGSAGASAGASGGTGQLAGQSVTVIGTWGGDEQDAFLKMVQPWEQQTGATVKYTGTRDLNTVLTTGVASGVLPDLAGLPGPGQMQEWANNLVDLSTVLDMNTYQNETAAPLVQLGQVNGKTVGVFIKTAVKGLIWYSPKTLPDIASSPPTSWDALTALGTSNATKAKAVWCLGIESGAASGWPGTDWIEDLVLRGAGPDVYNSWWQGKTKWTDPAIKAAWQAFGAVVASSYGGATAVNATNFANAGDPMFKNPPGCLFLHQASFITGLGAFKSAKAGTDYNFFPFPDVNPQYSGAVEGAGDLFGMFHDTPASRSLMAYLVTAQAQDIWVKIGGALSANKNATDYPDDISKRSAQLLLNAKTFVFDASDLMPTAMNDAFWKGIVQYVKSPDQLDSILANLDKVQADAYSQ